MTRPSTAEQYGFERHRFIRSCPLPKRQTPQSERAKLKIFLDPPLLSFKPDR
ncbi:MAG: hypothetical protein AAGG02_04810 [Cyanobacteria bacterium P01_H01_bin.15]